MFIRRIHEITQEIIYKFLRHGTRFHIGFHIDIRYLETQIFQHSLHRNYIWMYFTPGHRFHSYINDISSILTDFKNRCHRQARPTMTMILNDHFRMPLFNCFRQSPQHTRTTDTCHVFQTDFGCSGFDQLISNMSVILHCMYRRMRDTQRSLRYHTCFQCIFYRWNDIARFIQSTENTSDIHSLCMLHMIHQTTNIGRYRIHTQSIQTTIQHMCLYTCFIERFSKSTYGLVGVFAIQQIHLLKSPSVSFHTGKTPHFDNQGGDTYQLVYTRLIFTGRLPHVTVNKTEFNFFFHRSR